MLTLINDTVLTKGYSRSVIMSFSKTEFDFIPNLLYDNITKHNRKYTFEDLKKRFNTRYPQLFKEYFSFLNENQYITDIPSSVLDNFEDLPNSFDYPFTIENIIISLSDLNFQILIDLFEDLPANFTKNYGICVNASTHKLYKLIKTIMKRDVVFMKILINEDIHFDFKEINEYRDLIELETIKNISSYLLSERYKLRWPQFSFNSIMYSESQAHHTYFNRKLYVGPKGEIKNAPECEETFGNINEIENAEELKHIIATPEFQKYWYIHKELCDVCKDCEFRHMCVDSRLPFQREDKSWYHKTECNYNPYICKWEGEEGYQTLEECGVISDEKGFSIDHERIAAINKILWEEETEDV